MRFCVTYRTSDGSISKTELECGSRAEVVEFLKKEGGTPLKIDLRKSYKPSNPVVINRRARNLSAAILIVLIPVVLAYLLWPAERADPERKSPTKISPILNVEQGKTGAKVLNAQQSVTNAIADVERRSIVDKEQTTSNRYHRGVLVKSVSVSTNGDFVLERITTVDGKSHRIQHDIARPVFDNTSDQLLSVLTSAPAGNTLAPFPTQSDEQAEKEFKASLRKEIVISEDDPEDVRQIKQRVIQARQEMQEFLAQGMTVAEVIAEQSKLTRDNSEVRQDAMAELQKILRDGDLSGAEEFAKRVNATFRQLGIPELYLPGQRPRGKTARQVLPNDEKETTP